jgi:hypothetical protein
MELQQKIDLEEKLANRDAVSVAMETMVTLVNIFTAIGGNLLVCWTILRYPRLRSTSNLFIASLAVSDVLISVLGFPFIIAVLLTGRWPFNKAVCDFQGFTLTVFGGVSLLTMTFTAIARYFKVTRPLLHRKIYSKRNIYVSVAVVYAISTTFPVIVISKNAFTFHPGKYICIFDCDIVGVPVCLTVQVILIVTCFGPIVFCHIGIFRFVRQHNTRLATSREDPEKTANIQVDDMKVTKLLLAIVIAFAFCWSPLIIIDGMGLWTGHYWMPREVYMTSTYLACYSSSVNPVIYGIFNKQLRREFCKIFRCNRQRIARVEPHTY